MKTLGSFVRMSALLTAAGAMLISPAAWASLPTTGGTNQESGAVVWICLAGFVLGTLGIAFWNSKRHEAE